MEVVRWEKERKWDSEKGRRDRRGELRENLTLGSRECSGHSTWSRLQYVLL